MALLVQVNDLIANVLACDFAEYMAEQFGLDKAQVSLAVKGYLAQVPAQPTVEEAAFESVSLKKIEGNRKCPFVPPKDPSGTQCGVNIRGDFQYCSKHRFRKIST